LFYNHKRGGSSLGKFGLRSKLAIEVLCNQSNEVACTQEVLGREERERTTLLYIYKYKVTLKLSLQFGVGGSNIDIRCVFVMEEFLNSSSIFTLCALGVGREGRRSIISYTFAICLQIALLKFCCF